MGGLNAEGEYITSSTGAEDRSGEIVVKDSDPEFFERIITRQPLFTNIEPPLYKWIDLDEYVYGNYGKDWMYGVLAFPATSGVLGPIAKDNYEFAVNHVLSELEFAIDHLGPTVNLIKLLLQMLYGHGELIHETQQCLRDAPELKSAFDNLSSEIAERSSEAILHSGKRLMGGALYNRYLLKGGRHGPRILRGMSRSWRYGDIVVSFSFNLIMSTLGSMIRNVWESSILITETELHPNYSTRRQSVDLPGVAEMIAEAITGASNSFDGEMSDIETITTLRNVAGLCLAPDDFERALYNEFFNHIVDAAKGELQ